MPAFATVGDAAVLLGRRNQSPFMFVAAALALMSYGTALAVWQGLTLALYLLTMGAILGATTLRHPASDP